MATIGGSTTYRYDADNLRKLSIEPDGTPWCFIHGPGDQILTEFRKQGTNPLEIVQDYIYAGGILLGARKAGAHETILRVSFSTWSYR